jgi:signal transduction histidine kinase
MPQDEPPRPEPHRSSRPLPGTVRKRSSPFGRSVDSTSDSWLPRPNHSPTNERVTSTIRLVSVAAVFVAASVGSPRPDTTTYALLGLYAVYSVGLLAAARLGVSFDRTRLLAIHVVDVAAAASVIFLLDGTGVQLFVAIGFVLFATGYRWGVRETIWTGAAIALLLTVKVVVILTSGQPAAGAANPFTIESFLIELGDLVLLTVVVGYFAHQHRIGRATLAVTAAAAERARLARELHDGVIQSLLGIKLRFEVLRLSGSLDPSTINELREYEALLAREVVNLRMLMFQLSPSDERPLPLATELRDLVDRFGHASGITAQFVSTGNIDQFSPHACHEIIRIVQESVVNVHKHSGARQVLVRLVEREDRWELSVEDNGRGFDFGGRLAEDELDRLGKGPRIIKERARLLGGSVTIESNPGTGSKLTITLPPNI